MYYYFVCIDIAIELAWATHQTDVHPCLFLYIEFDKFFFLLHKYFNIFA